MFNSISHFNYTRQLVPLKNKLLSNNNFLPTKKFYFTKMFALARMGSNIQTKTNLISEITKYKNEFIKCQKFNMRSMKSKRKLRMANTKYKIKNHSGIMKRVRVVGPRFDRQIKFWPTGNVHKMTNKSSANLKNKKRARYISAVDLRRVKRLIPYFKRKKCKH